MENIRRVVLVDDHPLVREAVREVLLRRFKGIEVAPCGSLAEALANVSARPPELVLCDLDLPDAHGAGAVTAMRAALPPQVPVVVLSGETGPSTIATALAAGANGFVPKLADLQALVQALEPWLGPALPSVVATHASTGTAGSQLSARQLAVARELIKGLSNKEIARALGVSPETVKSHVSEVIGRLGARNRTEAVLRLSREGL
jgi:DNA-binding NarL/FixJ family response regulator